MMTNTALLLSWPPRPSIWANSHWSLGRPSKECINVRHQLLPHQCIQWSWCQAGHIPCRHTLCWSEACSSWKCKAENIFEKIHKMQFELLLPCSQCMHHPVLLFPCIVTAEFLNVGRSKVLKVQRSGSPLSPRCCTWNARRFEYSLGYSLQFLPRISDCVLSQYKDLHFEIAVTVSKKREDPWARLVNVPVEIRHQRYDTI